MKNENTKTYLIAALALLLGISVVLHFTKRDNVAETLKNSLEQEKKKREASEEVIGSLQLQNKNFQSVIDSLKTELDKSEKEIEDNLKQFKIEKDAFKKLPAPAADSLIMQYIRANQRFEQSTGS